MSYLTYSRSMTEDEEAAWVARGGTPIATAGRVITPPHVRAAAQAKTPKPRVCRECGVALTLDNNRAGLLCNPCANQRHAAWQRAHREHMNAYMRQYLSDPEKRDRQREALRRYRAKKRAEQQEAATPT